MTGDSDTYEVALRRGAQDTGPPTGPQPSQRLLLYRLLFLAKVRMFSG
jgi:hypothetical protein